MEKLTGVNSRIHQAREQKRDISVRSVSQDFRKLHHGQSPVFFTSARLKPNISHYFVLFSVCFSLHQINSRKITHFLLFFSCFLSCFRFLNIISTQENIPHYFPSSPAKLETTNLGGIQGPMVQQLNRLNWISHRQGHSLAFKVLGCWICAVDNRHGPRHNVRVPCSCWQYERYHLKAHDSDRLRTFFGCLTPAVTDRVLSLHAADQQFHQLSFALVLFL